MASHTSCSCGRITCSRARVSISACEVLLMSSEVQEKWMNSAAADSSAWSATFSFNQYSTAFTSWFVVRSMALMRAASSSEKFCTRLLSTSRAWRSEEHTSELQSRENLVCRLLLE